MAIEASFAKELPSFQDSDHCLLALFGDNENLDSSLLNIENRICGIALRKNHPVPVKIQYGFAVPDLGEKTFWIKYSFRRSWHEAPGARYGLKFSRPGPSLLSKISVLFRTTLPEIRASQFIAALSIPHKNVRGRLENQIAMGIEGTEKAFFVMP